MQCPKCQYPTLASSPTCSKCGEPLRTSTLAAEKADPRQPEFQDIDYSEIPFYRKRWFLVLSFLIFVPVTALITLSGDIYMQKSDGVYRFSSTHKNNILILSLVWSALGFFRVFMSLIG